MHDAPALSVLYVSQMDQVQDPVTGEAVPAFCVGPDCVRFTPKTMRAPPRVTPPAQPTAPKAAPVQSPPATPPAATASPEPLRLRLAFAYNSHILSPAAKTQLLQTVVPVGASAKTVSVVGVADSLRRDKHNLALALRRAETVADFLKPHLSAATFSTTARVFKVTTEGYPIEEPYLARRVDLSVLLLD